MTHIAPLVAVVLASLLERTAAEASILCTWTKVLPNEEEHYNFLRQDSSSLRLYHSVWSKQRALLSCAWSDDAAVIQNYVSLCRERTLEFSAHSDVNLNWNDLLEAQDPCVYLSFSGVAEHGPRTGRRPARSIDGLSTAMNSQGQDERSEVKSLRRVKRGFIVPGTLWCGSGNKAPSYEDLGVFADTDSCCREHDQCKHTILSFHSEFGVFNTNIFTMSHCECDHKFRRCLMEANDSISHAVGYTFFNLLKMHCFEFSHKLQCSQRNWFGLCKESKMALYAEVYPPTLFESSSSTEVSTNSSSSISNMSASAQLQGSSISEPPFFLVSVPTPSTASSSASISTEPSTASSSASISTEPSTASSSASISTEPSSASSSASVNTDASISTEPLPGSPAASSDTSTVPTLWPNSPSASIPAVTNVTTANVENTLPRKSRPREQDTEITGKLLVCGIYKDLDKCRNKIPPQEKMFGLHNLEPRTLYHCNCTSRLFQAVAEQTQLTKVQALLLEHVSRSCFLPQDCTTGKTCTAVVLKVDFPPVERSSSSSSSSAQAGEQLHLQAVELKVRRPMGSRAKRKDRAVGLHKRCLRMIRRKTNQRRSALSSIVMMPQSG